MVATSPVTDLVLRHVLLILSVSLVVVSSTQCNIMDLKKPCRCTFKLSTNGDTRTIDISKYFVYPYHPKPDDAKYLYTFTCVNTKCPKNKDPNAKGVACQYNEGQDADTPLGKVDNKTKWEVVDENPQTFQFTITYADGQDGRMTTVKFTYDSTQPMSMAVTEDKDSKYVMEASGNRVKMIVPVGGGSNDIAGPIGLSLIFVSIAALVAYFVVGMVYMYKQKGARGVEMVPNLHFWRDLPHLIKDGFFFTISPCYKRGGDYQKL